MSDASERQGDDEQRFVTPEFTANYVFLDQKKEPSDQYPDSPAVWCLTMALAKDSPFWPELQMRIELAAENVGLNPQGEFLNPIKDGDKEKDESFHGKFVIRLKNGDRKPGVKVFNPDGANTNVVDYREEIYSGMVAVATARAGGYTKGSGGVNLYLDNVLKVRDGERIGRSTPSAEADFENFVSDSATPSTSNKGARSAGRRRRSALA